METLNKDQTKFKYFYKEKMFALTGCIIDNYILLDEASEIEKLTLNKINRWCLERQLSLATDIFLLPQQKQDDFDLVYVNFEMVILHKVTDKLIIKATLKFQIDHSEKVVRSEALISYAKKVAHEWVPEAEDYFEWLMTFQNIKDLRGGNV